MWGSIVHDENQALVSAVIYLSVSALGAGKFINIGEKTNATVKFIAAISPIRYAVERMFRRIVPHDMIGHTLLQFFGFTLGDWYCAKTLA